jgi:hypothetical protein
LQIFPNLLFFSLKNAARKEEGVSRKKKGE